MDTIAHPRQKKMQGKIGSIWLGGFPGAEVIENLAQRKRALPDYEIVLLLDKSSEKILKKTFYTGNAKMENRVSGLLDATTDLSVYDYLKNAGVILERYEVMMGRVKKSYHHHGVSEVEINKLFSQMETMIKESRRGFGDLAEISDMLRIVFLADSENIKKGVAYFDADLFFKRDKVPRLMQEVSAVLAGKFDSFLTVDEDVGFKMPYIKGAWGEPQINNNIMVASTNGKAKQRLLAILKSMINADHLMRQAYFKLESGEKINLLSIKKTVADLSPILAKKQAIQLVSDYERKENKKALDTKSMFSGEVFENEQAEKNFFKAKAKEKVEGLLSAGKPLSKYYLIDEVGHIRVSVNYQDIANLLYALGVLPVHRREDITPAMAENGITIIGGERVLFSEIKKEYSVSFRPDSKIELHLALRWYFPITNELSKAIQDIPKARKGSYFDFIKPRLFKNNVPSLAIPSLLKPLILVTDEDLKKIGLKEDVSRRGLSWARARKEYARSDALSGEEMFCVRPGLIKRDLGNHRLCKSIKKNNGVELQKKQQKAYLLLSNFLSKSRIDAEVTPIPQGSYSLAIASNTGNTNKKSAAITRAFSQALFLGKPAYNTLLSNLQASVEIYERIAQAKPISPREASEVKAFSRSFNGFAQKRDLLNSLPSIFCFMRGYRTIDDIATYLTSQGIQHDVALHVTIHKHVIAIYRTDNRYAYFDSNRIFISNLKNVSSLITILSKTWEFDGYQVLPKKLYVEYFDVHKANQRLPSHKRKNLSQQIKTERTALSLQDKKLGSIHLYSYSFSRVTLYDLGVQHIEGIKLWSLDTETALSNQNIVDYLKRGQLVLSAQDYLAYLRGENRIEKQIKITQFFSVVGDQSEIEQVVHVRNLVTSDDQNVLSHHALNELLTPRQEKSIQIVAPHYQAVLKKNHWPHRLMNTAGGLSLLHGAYTSLQAVKYGDHVGFLFGAGEISYSFLSHLIENKVIKITLPLIKNLKHGLIISRGLAGVVSNPFDIYSLISSSIDANNAVKGSKEFRDNIANIVFSGASLSSSVAFTAINLPGAGMFFGLTILFSQGIYNGASMVSEYKKYNLTTAETFRLFGHALMLQPVPNDMQYLAARQDSLNELAKNINEILRNNTSIAAYATGIGDIVFKEHQAFEYFLFPSHAKILMRLSILRLPPYVKNFHLSRIVTDSILTNPDYSAICLPAFNYNEYEYDHTLGAQLSPIYRTSDHVTSYCENAMVIENKQGNSSKKILFNLDLVSRGIIVGKDNGWQNDFLVGQGNNIIILGGKNARNVFILIHYTFGIIIGIQKSVNLLDASKIKGLIDIKQLPYNADDATEEEKVIKTLEKNGHPNSVYNMDTIIISANTTVKSELEHTTVYVKPAAGFSSIHISQGIVLFPDTAILRESNHVNYFPKTNILYLDMGRFKLNIGNYFNSTQKNYNVKLIDKQGSVIEPFLNLTHPHEDIPVTFFNLKTETTLSSEAIPNWYKTISEAREAYHVYGIVKEKHTDTEDVYRLFGTLASDVLPLSYQVRYAEGRENSDFYNVVLGNQTSFTIEINNYALDNLLDFIYIPIETIQLHTNKNNLQLYEEKTGFTIIIKNYFLNDNYRHLVVIDSNKALWMPFEHSLDHHMALLPFYRITQEGNVFSLPATDTVVSKADCIVEAKLEELEFYKSSNHLLLIKNNSLLLNLENFYEKQSNITIHLWQGNWQERLSSTQLEALAKLAINYQDYLKTSYNAIIKEYIYSKYNTIFKAVAIYHNQEFINGHLQMTENPRIGVLILEAMNIKVLAKNTDLIFSFGESNTVTLKNWNDATSYRISVLQFNYEEKVLEIRKLEQFDLSQLSKLQSLINKAALNHLADKKLAVLDNQIVNAIKYRLVISGIENTIQTYRCLRFGSPEEEQGFIVMHLKAENSLPALQTHHAVNALIWLLVKGYTGLLLDNENIPLTSTLKNCFNPLIDNTLLAQLLNEIKKTDNGSEEVENFIKEHNIALEKNLSQGLHVETNKIEESKSPIFPFSAQALRVFSKAEEAPKLRITGKTERDKSIADGMNLYVWPTVMGVGVILGVSMGYRFHIRRRLTPPPVAPRAAAMTLALLAPLTQIESTQSSEILSTPFIYSSNRCIKSEAPMGLIGFCHNERRIIYWWQENDSTLFNFETYLIDSANHHLSYENKSQGLFDEKSIEPKAIPFDRMQDYLPPHLKKALEAQKEQQMVLRAFRQQLLVSTGHYIGNIFSLHTRLGDLFNLVGLSPNWLARDDTHFINRCYVTSYQLLSELSWPGKLQSLSASLLEVALLHPRSHSKYVSLTKGGDYLKLKCIVRFIGDILQFGIYNISTVARFLEYSFPSNESMHKLSVGIQMVNQFYMLTDDLSYWYLGMALFVLPYLPSVLETIGLPVTRGMASLCNSLAQLFIGQSILNQLPEDKARVAQSQRELMLADKRVNQGFLSDRFTFFNKSNDNAYMGSIDSTVRPSRTDIKYSI